MDSYIAIIRIGECPSRQYLASSVSASLMALTGVTRVDFDAAGRALLVWFNRARVSLGDLVRSIECQGLTVCGVAQSRDSGLGSVARPATA